MILKIRNLLLGITALIVLVFYFIIIIASNSILKNNYLLPTYLVLLIQAIMVLIVVIPIYLLYQRTLKKESQKLKNIADNINFQFIARKQKFGSKYFNEKKHSDLKFNIITRLILKIIGITIISFVLSYGFIVEEGWFPFPAFIGILFSIRVILRHKILKKNEEEDDKYLDSKGLKRVLKVGNILLDDVSHESKLNGVSISNIMEKLSEDVQMSMFDREYVERRGRTTSFIEDTIFLVKSNKLNLPLFTLAPERLGSSIERFFGLKDINFIDYPNFSSKYILSSNDQKRIEKVFTQKIITFFEANDNMYVQSENGYIFFIKKQSKTEERELLFKTYLQVVNMFMKKNQ